MYTPDPTNDPIIDAIIAAIQANNDPKIPDNKVLRKSSLEEANTYLYKHPETVLAAVHFTEVAKSGGGLLEKISYGIQVNEVGPLPATVTQ